ncbi:MAG: hypothetical protein JEZ11_00430 [Desulfobacterales bacterium]|nr:hypothetical protein [Desulfobacterales bacterium]
MTSDLYICSEEGSHADRLRQVVDATVTPRQATYFTTIDDLCQCFRGYVPQPAMVIILINDNDRLQALLSSSDLFQDHQLILILPYGKADLLDPCLALRPRYIAPADGDFSDIQSILVKRFSATAAAVVRDPNNDRPAPVTASGCAASNQSCQEG